MEEEETLGGVVHPWAQAMPVELCALGRVAGLGRAMLGWDWEPGLLPSRFFSSHSWVH